MPKSENTRDLLLKQRGRGALLQKRHAREGIIQKIGIYKRTS